MHTSLHYTNTLIYINKQTDRQTYQCFLKLVLILVILLLELVGARKHVLVLAVEAGDAVRAVPLQLLRFAQIRLQTLL